jgi:hypothetical protein
VFETLQGLGEIGLRLAVPFVEELVEDLGLLQLLGEPLVSIDLAAQAREAPVQLLAPRGVVPDVRLG